MHFILYRKLVIIISANLLRFMQLIFIVCFVCCAITPLPKVSCRVQNSNPCFIPSYLYLSIHIDGLLFSDCRLWLTVLIFFNFCWFKHKSELIVYDKHKSGRLVSLLNCFTFFHFSSLIAYYAVWVF